jgi:predicted outer membrane repeat protein
MNIKAAMLIVPFAISAAVQFGTARAATLTVCPSGCEHTTIQGAISHANNGDTISIGKGHYFETVNTQGKALTLEGIDARQVVVDANGTGSVITIPGTNPVSISNLTITRGYASATAGVAGGGISITDSAPLTLTNSNVVFNYSTTVGGGLYSFVGNVTITGCTIADNQAPILFGGLRTGGGIMTGADTLSIDNSTIARNAGGGISLDGEGAATVTVNKSSIVDNTLGGGVSNPSGVGTNSVLVQNSTIAGNSTNGDGGGIYTDGGTTTLKNVVLTRNTAAGQGGGIFASVGGLHNHQPYTTIQNSYIVLNTATVDGGGTYLQGIVVDDGADVTGNLPDNCGKGTTCP